MIRNLSVFGWVEDDSNFEIRNPKLFTKGWNVLSPGSIGPIIFGMQRYLIWSLVVLSVAIAVPTSAGEIVRLRVEDTSQPASQQFIERALA